MYRMDDIPQALLHPLKVMDKSTQRMLRPVSYTHLKEELIIINANTDSLFYILQVKAIIQ